MVRVGQPAFVGICSHSTLVVFITAQQIAFITVPRFSTESDFYVPELDCTDLNVKAGLCTTCCPGVK